MHVARIYSGYTDKQGRRREYESVYLRRTYRDGSRIRHDTLANLSGLPERTVGLIEAALKGAPPVSAGDAVTITRSLPHGHVAAVHAMAVRLGLPALLGPAGRQRDLALALVVSRVVAPAPGPATRTWWSDTTLGEDLGVAKASTDEVHAAMDWLEARQHSIEANLARRLSWHLRRVWAPLTFTGENPPHDEADRPCRSFRGLLGHLATLTRNQVRVAGAHATVLVLAEPTSIQREAFDLIGVPIPLTLK